VDGQVNALELWVSKKLFDFFVIALNPNPQDSSNQESREIRFIFLTLIHDRVPVNSQEISVTFLEPVR
jgi:hypothetical protein